MILRIDKTWYFDVMACIQICAHTQTHIHREMIDHLILLFSFFLFLCFPLFYLLIVISYLFSRIRFVPCFQLQVIQVKQRDMNVYCFSLGGYVC